MNVVVTSIDYILNWSRANSLWPLSFATSCCGIEMMQTVASNNDIARFGSENLSLAYAGLFFLGYTKKIKRRFS